MSLKVFVSTHPFGTVSSLPTSLLAEYGFEVRYNPYSRKMTSEELASHIQDTEVLLAATEQITEQVLASASQLRIIVRIGIGLDNIDMDLCRKYNVRVTYTPDAPTMAVAELCVGYWLTLGRNIHHTSHLLKSKGRWERYMGMGLRGKTIGILGLGRVGKSLVHLLTAFGVKCIAYDIVHDRAFARLYNVEYMDKDSIFKQSDVISVHLPLTSDTYDFVTARELAMMPPHSFLLHTSRGGVVNESDLFNILKSNGIAGAAVDVFEKEPYNGPLTQIDNCILTCHMGAASVECRIDMEVSAVEEAIRYKKNEALINEIL